MNGRFRRRYISAVLLIAFVTVAAAIVALVQFQAEHPLPPLVPATETERHVLNLATQLVQSRAPDFVVPIAIDPQADGKAYTVVYWTPRSELELLGPRTVIVNLELNTAEIPLRD
jgi:hypothetical protein